MSALVSALATGIVFIAVLTCAGILVLAVIAKAQQEANQE